MWGVGGLAIPLFSHVTYCNKIRQMLDFARSAYSCNLGLVRHLAFRIKRNFAFRLFIDN